jgi:hypothetical protein
MYDLYSRIEINSFETISGLPATHHETFILASVCLHRPDVVAEPSALHRSGKMDVLTWQALVSQQLYRVVSHSEDKFGIEKWRSSNAEQRKALPIGNPE